MSPHIMLFILVSTCLCNHTALAAKGSRATITNNSTYPLRLLQYEGAPKADPANILFMITGQSHTFQGYNDGYGGNLDVTFVLERFCLGLSDSKVSVFSDQWVTVASVVFNNPWQSAYK